MMHRQQAYPCDCDTDGWMDSLDIYLWCVKEAVKWLIVAIINVAEFRISRLEYTSASIFRSSMLSFYPGIYR
jgi:hypothetical protein